MNTGFLLFQITASGPSQLRTTLRRAVRAAITSIPDARSIRDLHSSIPEELLGGELLGILSRSVRRLIENSGTSAKGTREAEAPAMMPWQSQIGGNPASASSLTTALPQHKESRAWQAQVLRENASRTGASKAQDDLRQRAESAPFMEAPQRRRASAVAESLRDVTSIPAPAGLTEKLSKRVRPRQASLSLALKQYFEIVQQNSSASSQNPQTIPVLNSEKTSVPVSGVPENRPRPKSWPDITGAEAARRISSLGEQSPSQISSSRVKNTVRLQQPDRINIRNVFQIQVQGNPNERDLLQRDLAQNLADLLREQAMQYGIDDV